MALSPQQANLKRWKRKFLGITDEGTADSREDVNIKAQKLINIFRQLSVLGKDAIEHYNDMLLHISPDIRSTLSTLPCGSDVRGYISYLQERRGLPIEEDADDDVEKTEGRKQAEIIAEAISKSTSKTAEQMQEQSLKQVEMLTKTLAEAQSKHASVDDIAKITAAIQAAQAGMASVSSAPQTRKVKKKVKDKNGKEVEVEVDEPIPAPSGTVPVAPVVTGPSMASAIGSAVADAIVKSQHQTAEIISKMLADALSKPQQTQHDNLKEISNILAESQEKTAKIILDNIGDAISKPQQIQNDGLKELSKMLTSSNEKTIDAISNSIREGISGAPITKDGTGTLDQFANLINTSQDKTAETILRALGKVIENTPESHSLHEVSEILSHSQEKTAHIITNSLVNMTSKEEKRDSKKNDAILAMLKAQEENNRILRKLLYKISGEEDPDDVKPLSVEELKKNLQKIDATIAPEFTGKMPKLPKGIPSSSNSQPADIDHDFEYEYYALDDNGELTPFNPELNPDVDYEIIDEVEENSAKFSSYAKKNKLLAPDISEALEEIKEKIEEAEDNQVQKVTSENDSIIANKKTTFETPNTTADFLGLFEEEYDYKCGKTNVDDFYHWLNTLDLNRFSKDASTESKDASTNVDVKADSTKALPFADTKQIPAPVSGKTIPMPDLSDKPKELRYDSSHKNKELLVSDKTKKTPKSKSSKVATPVLKKKMLTSSATRSWVKNTTPKTARKSSKSPFVIIASDDGEGNSGQNLH